MRAYIINVILGVSIIGFLIFLYSYFHECKESMEITTAIDEIQIEIDDLINKPTESTNGVNQVLPKYQSLYSENKDMIGFIYLGDNHRFPILQRIDDQNYYLDHDFFGNESSSGSIFANTKCHLGDSGITLIYGHHIKRNQMFSCLDSFKNKDFFENAKSIQIDTLYSEDFYKVAAVALVNMNDTFKYYEYVGSLSDGAFKLWKYNMSEKLLWGSIEDLSYEDTIVELSTCSYEKEGNRLIVILVKENYRDEDS